MYPKVQFSNTRVSPKFTFSHKCPTEFEDGIEETQTYKIGAVMGDKTNFVLSTKTVFTIEQLFPTPTLFCCEFISAKEIVLFFRQVAEGSHTFYATSATILFCSCDAIFVTKFKIIKRVFPVFLIIKPTRCTNFSNLFLKLNSTCFGQFPLSIIRSFSLYTQQCYMSYRFADCLRAGSGWNCVPS